MKKYRIRQISDQEFIAEVQTGFIFKRWWGISLCTGNLWSSPQNKTDFCMGSKERCERAAAIRNESGTPIEYLFLPYD